MYHLDLNPKAQQQPCWSSCVPTSIAMAVGVPVQEILDRLEALSLDYSNGLTTPECEYLLVDMGLGSHTYLAEGLGMLDGHYLAQVLSRNKIGYTHCIFIHVIDQQAAIFDPNEGRDGMNYYKELAGTPLISLTRLNDFREYK